MLRRAVWIVSLIIIGTGLGSATAAQDGQNSRHRLVMPSVRTATDCLTYAVSQRLPASSQPPRAQVREAIRTVLDGGACEKAVTDMVAQRDRVYGAGSGSAFFSGPYLADLPRAVTERLRASTGPSASPASTVTQATPVTASGTVLAHADPHTPTTPSVTPPTVHGTITDKVDADTLRRNASLFLAIVGACTFILFVLGCGNRVVVFASPSDLGMSATIVLAPIITVLLVVAAGLTIAQPPDRTYANAWENAKDNPFLAFLIIAGGLTWVWSVLGTIYSSIKHNGFIVGPVIAILKLGAMIALFLVWFGAWKNYEYSERYTQTIAKLVTIGFLFWIGSKLVNGPRVVERRGMVAGARPLAIV